MTAINGAINRLKALIHCAKKDLELSDEAYRIILESLTGKSSCKDMSFSQLNHVLEAFKKQGFVVTTKAKPNPKVAAISKEVKLPTRKPRDNDPRLGKIWKLWYLLAEHEQTNGSAEALNAFIKKQTGLENQNWLKTNEDFDAVIQALKAWCGRKGINLGGGRA